MWRAILSILIVALPAGAQISPGPLSRPHAALEGASRCKECHEPRKGITRERCEACHEAIAVQRRTKRGFHAKITQSCERCHNEHHGRDFQLIHWGSGGPASFDHRSTGFPLIGAHAKTTCRGCHAPKNQRRREHFRNVNPARTFLGLDRECLSCHTDAHRGQFRSNECLTCHSMQGWRSPGRFDHQKTSFPLTGLHAKVACRSCHATAKDSAGAAFTVFRGVRHGSCSDCHKDPHAGRFGKCSTCHDTTGWKRVSTENFDHAKTRFPLTGQHRTVNCRTCHERPKGSGKLQYRGIAFASCTSCHTDPHRGRFGTKCDSCHTTAAWRSVERSKVDHDRTRFPLHGRHRTVACAECHASGKSFRRGNFSECTDCHRDPHGGQMTKSAAGCESCHSVQGFAPSSFTVERHQKTRFALTGAHLAVSCPQCHLPGASKAASLARGTFRFQSLACSSCHRDPHRGEMTRFMTAAGCATCHSVLSWQRAAFDHDRTGFPLDGAHRAVRCDGCHQIRTAGGTERRFKGTPRTCSACHGRTPAQ